MSLEHMQLNRSEAITTDFSSNETLVKKFESNDNSAKYNSRSFLKSAKQIGNIVLAITQSESKGELTAGQDVDIKTNRLVVLDKDLGIKYTSLNSTFYDDKRTRHFPNRDVATNPHNEYVEILGVKGTTVEIVCADGNTVQVEIPEEILTA